MQLPDGPPSRRPIWQNAALLTAMIAFLVFSDWFNPGDKNVELADGTQFAATLQYETELNYDLRLREGSVFVDGEPLIFYHFNSVRILNRWL